jgi:hypothetical protein
MDEVVRDAPQPTLYDVLAEVAVSRTQPTPDTVETKQIETVDNDFATTLLGGLGI